MSIKYEVIEPNYVQILRLQLKILRGQLKVLRGHNPQQMVSLVEVVRYLALKQPDDLEKVLNEQRAIARKETSK
jgi:hypothetical protein